MWAGQIFLGILGMSAGVVVAGGLFSFIVELGVISDFADRTHTANRILLYEDAVSSPGQSLEMSFRSFGLEFPDSPCCWHFSDYLPGFLSAAGRWHLQRS